MGDKDKNQDNQQSGEPESFGISTVKKSEQDDEPRGFGIRSVFEDANDD